MPIPRTLPPTSRPRSSLRAFALAVGISALALVGAPARADSLEEANQLVRAGQHAKALEQVNRYLSAKPKDAQGRFLKGIILTSLNKPAEAITVFQKLSEDYPELPEPYNNLAVIYAQQKQYEKAKQALEMAIRTHPAYATAHENLGDIHSRLASEAYGKALQIDSSNTSAQTKLSMISALVDGPKIGAGKTAGGKPSVAPVPAPPAAVVASAETKIEVKAEVLPAAASKPAPAPLPPAQTKPADAKPAVAAAPTVKPDPVAPAGNLNSEVTAAIDAWLAAWSKKDVKTYLAHYAKDFQAPKGQSRKAWETERSQRVGKPGKIEVGRDKLNIKAEGSDKAIVRFRQSYQSTGFSSSSGKTLELIKRDGKWLILQERVGG